MGHKLAVIQRIQSVLVTVYLLELVSAAAVTSLGWAGCRVLQIDWIASVPLWFGGYLLVYNLDRLYRDPADAVNIPIRARKTENLRPFRVGLCFLSGIMLVFWLAFTGRWQLVFPVTLSVAILQFHSRPIPGVGFRPKDIPYIKSILAPAVIAGVLVVWPCVESGKNFRLKEWLVFVLCLLVLTINSLVFDYRDVDGDAVVGTATIPVRLGRRKTIYLLIALAVTLVGVSGWLAMKRFVSPFMPAALAIGSAGLLFAVLSPLYPMTISVLADLLLLVPAAVENFD